MSEPEGKRGGEGLRTADGYEAKYMGDKGDVLLREKAIAPPSWQLMFGGLVALELITMVVMLAAGMGPVALAIFLPAALAFFVLWMLFAVIRVSVSTDCFHVQFGLFGPKIAVADIVSAESIRYDWTEFGGWGIKRSFRDGTVIYNMWGDDGRAVKVTYRDAKGELKRVAVGSSNADAIVVALQRARAAQEKATATTQREDPVEQVEEVEGEIAGDESAARRG
jgi:hypothetical protein